MYSVPHRMARIQISICIIQSYWVFELCRITIMIVQSTITRVIIDWKHMYFPMLLVLNVKPTKTRIILKESLDGELFISGWPMGCMWRKILSMDVGRKHPLRYWTAERSTKVAESEQVRMHLLCICLGLRM